jgi:hypothetical protein
MSAGDRVIRWSTAFAVLGVAAVAAVASYEHAYDLVRGLRASEPQRHELTVNLYFVGNLNWPPAEHIA